jgi:AcrR family transcriptional regulator
MATEAGAGAESRKRLNRDRVLEAAIAHADQGGLGALTIRQLAEMLQVAPMALYRHVSGKDDLIDAMVDVVFSEIGVPSGGGDWKTAMRRRAIAVRDALSRHPWAVGLMESRRAPGPANLRHHDAMIGRLRAAGFDVAMAAHAYSLLDSYIYGFALTKMALPFEASEDVADVAEAMLRPFPVNQYPNLVEFIDDHVMKPGYDFEAEFEYGLDVILDGIERVQDGRAAAAAST